MSFVPCRFSYSNLPHIQIMDLGRDDASKDLDDFHVWSNEVWCWSSRGKQFGGEHGSIPTQITLAMDMFSIYIPASIKFMYLTTEVLTVHTLNLCDFQYFDSVLSIKSYEFLPTLRHRNEHQSGFMVEQRCELSWAGNNIFMDKSEAITNRTPVCAASALLFSCHYGSQGYWWSHIIHTLRKRAHSTSCGLNELGGRIRDVSVGTQSKQTNKQTNKPTKIPKKTNKTNKTNAGYPESPKWRVNVLYNSELVNLWPQQNDINIYT